MERLVWMLQRFDPVTDLQVSALRVDALLTRQIARVVEPSSRRLDAIVDHPVTPAMRERIASLLGFDLSEGDLEISYLTRPAEWDGVVSETWWIRPPGADESHPDSVFIDDILLARIQFLVASEDDPRFDSWPLDATGIRGFGTLTGQDLDETSPDYFLTCLRADYAVPSAVRPLVSSPGRPVNA